MAIGVVVVGAAVVGCHCVPMCKLGGTTGGPKLVTGQAAVGPGQATVVKPVGREGGAEGHVRSASTGAARDVHQMKQMQPIMYAEYTPDHKFLVMWNNDTNLYLWKAQGRPGRVAVGGRDKWRTERGK